MMPIAALERRRGAFLVRVRGDQGGVHVDDQRLARVGLVVGGVVTGQLPRAGAGSGAGGVDRGQHSGRVQGEAVDRA
jgi:hypothetical protein